MKLTVYRQAYKERPGGVISYKGEDARPYVGEHVFFVADGLGGASAIRHQSFRKDLFEEEKLLDTLFDGIYEKYDDEEFSRYVMDSFFEFRAVKDCYFSNIYNIKKSGYFASRIVSAILLRELKDNPSYYENDVFDALNAANGEEERKTCLAGIGERFRHVIDTKLRQISEKTNLIYESVYSGLALLGTTLCATLYRDCPDAVEAIYLVAGDSRPYFWNSEGLCQVTSDQERSDGGMTNYIKANGPFEIICTYHRFPKPCMLFNASDGCFDSRYFLSPVSFERLLLKTISEAESMEAAGAALDEIFTDYGTHDDSSTMALRAFGYDSFDDLKAAAVQRLAALSDTYFSCGEELFSRDFAQELNSVKDAAADKLRTLRRTLRDNRGVEEYCVKALEEGKDDAFLTAVEDIDSHIDVCRRSIERERKALSDFAEKYYASLAGLVDPDAAAKPDESEEMRGAIEAGLADFRQTLVGYGEDLRLIARFFSEELDTVAGLSCPWTLENFEVIDHSDLMECKKKLGQIFAFFTEIEEGKNGRLQRIAVQVNAFYRENRNMAKKNPETVRMICDALIDGRIDPVAIDIYESDRSALSAALKSVHWSAETMKACGEERRKKVSEYISAYRDAHLDEILRSLSESGSPYLSEEEHRMLAEALASPDARVSELNAEMDKQRRLFEQYETHYYKLIRGDVQ